MQLLITKTYLSMIRASIGTTMFRHVFAEVDGVEKDLLEDGQLSCAFYVSSMLSMFHLIGAQHTTVASTVKDLLESGWRGGVAEPCEGCVVVWESQVQKPGGDPHEHIGFYMGSETAISHRDNVLSPVEHHWTYDGTRAITLMLAHPILHPTL